MSMVFTTNSDDNMDHKTMKDYTGKTWEASTDSKSVSQWHIYGMENHQSLSIYHSCKQIFFATI